MDARLIGLLEIEAPSASQRINCGTRLPGR